MNVLKILSQKDFSARLFTGETFDNFLVTEAAFVTSFSSDFSGRRPAGSPGEEEFIPWRVLRPVAFSLIRGKDLPKSFHIILRLNTENTAKTLSSYGEDSLPAGQTGLYLNIRYEAETLTCTSGVSCPAFEKSLSLGRSWDRTVIRFLETSSLPAEPL